MARAVHGRLRVPPLPCELWSVARLTSSVDSLGTDQRASVSTCRASQKSALSQVVVSAPNLPPAVLDKPRSRYERRRITRHGNISLWGGSLWLDHSRLGTAERRPHAPQRGERRRYFVYLSSRLRPRSLVAVCCPPEPPERPVSVPAHMLVSRAGTLTTMTNTDDRDLRQRPRRITGS